MVRTAFVRSSVFMAVSLVATAWSQAADESNLSEPVIAMLNDKVMRFLDGVSQGNQNEAFNDLLLRSRLGEQAGAVQGLIDKSKELVERYGAYRESEAIGAKRIGKDVVLLKYLFKCEKFPVVWYFTYYRDLGSAAKTPDDPWVIISVRFDTQLELLGY